MKRLSAILDPNSKLMVPKFSNLSVSSRTGFGLLADSLFCITSRNIIGLELPIISKKHEKKKFCGRIRKHSLN